MTVQTAGSDSIRVVSELEGELAVVRVRDQDWTQRASFAAAARSTHQLHEGAAAIPY